MNFVDFYRERIPNLPTPNERGEVVVPCVFHEDSSPSLGINLETGKWKCFATHCPGHKGGGYKTFERLLNGDTAGFEIKQPFIEAALVEAHHKVLLNSPQVLEFLRKKRGYTDATIERFRLGWDGDRVWIPIADERKDYVNIRKYKSGAGRDKMVPYAAGYNRVRLFPVDNLKSDWVLLCEGETDCILACQFGYPAITTTGGADAWRDEFTAALENKQVLICYDADSTGIKGAQQIAMKLLGRAKEVKIVHLPLAGTKEEKDVTNYLVDLGHSKSDFDALLAGAECVVDRSGAAGDPGAEVLELHLSEVGEDQYVRRRVRSTVLVAGKDLAPFQVPYRINYKCEMGEKICERCGICRSGGQKEIQLPEHSQALLEMINVNNNQLNAVLADLAGVPGQCRKFKAEVSEYANIEAVKAIPEIDFDAERSEYVIRNLYYLGHGLATNHTYRVEAVVMPDPKTQYATALVYKAEPSQDSIEKFEATEELIQALDIFRVGR